MGNLGRHAHGLGISPTAFGPPLGAGSFGSLRAQVVEEHRVANPQHEDTQMDAQLLQDLYESLASLPPGVVSIGSFLAGNLLGYRLGLAKDRRNEFNNAAQPIREHLLTCIERPGWNGGGPTLLELDRFEHCLPRWRRKGFRREWYAQYDERVKAANQNPRTGEISYPDTSQLVASYQRTLKYTTWR